MAWGVDMVRCCTMGRWLPGDTGDDVGSPIARDALAAGGVGGADDEVVGAIVEEVSAVQHEGEIRFANVATCIELNRNDGRRCMDAAAKRSMKDESPERGCAQIGRSIQVDIAQRGQVLKLRGGDVVCDFVVSVTCG